MKKFLPALVSVVFSSYQSYLLQHYLVLYQTNERLISKEIVVWLQWQSETQNLVSKGCKGQMKRMVQRLCFDS